MAGKFFLSGAFALAGTGVVAAKYVAGRLGPFTIAAASLLFALLVLLPLCAGKFRAGLGGMSRRAWIMTVLQAFFGVFLLRALLIGGVSRTSAAEAGILTGATPALTAFLAWAILREAVDGKILGGIVSTILGVLLVQGLGTRISLPGGHLTGNLLVLGAAASESAFNILSRLSAKESCGPLDPLVQTTLVTAAAFLLCLFPALGERPVARLAAIGPIDWLTLFWYGAFVTALAFLCWFAGIRRSGAIAAAAFSGMMPLTSMLLSTLLLGERSCPTQWAGGLLIVAGMALIGFQKERVIKE
jgi:drug/metabolite transporter (DMT)-like permease